MRRGTIVVFFFFLLALAIIGASQFLQRQPPLEITVAADPLAEAWVRETVAALNATGPVVNATRRVQFVVTAVDDLDAWTGEPVWNMERHTDLWIPAASASVTYGNVNGLRMRVLEPSLARTPLVWGGYASRVDIVTADGQPFDWEAVAAAASKESWQAIGGQASWGFIKLGFAQPTRKIGGVAAMFTGAGAFNQSPTLTSGTLSSQPFRQWLRPVIKSVPNFNTLGGDPAGAMTRGPSTVEIALLPEVMWLNNLPGLLKNEPIRLVYPAFQFMLDFPLAAWEDERTSPDERAAADLLHQWLIAPERQARLTAFGLRPVQDEPTTADVLFTAAAGAGIMLVPDYGQMIQAPSLGDAQGLIQWAKTQLQ